MGKYKIKISYKTGDSFNDYEREDNLELDWDDLSIAKANLQRINEHYQQYKSLNGYSTKSKSREQIFKDNRKKDWFVGFERNGRTDDYMAEHCIILKTDGDADLQLSCFWCGYFESLRSAEIIIDNSDMKIEF